MAVSSHVSAEEPSDSAIAIVGMVGRFPGADTVDEFWRLLREGREGISRFSDAELAAAGAPDELIRDPAYVRAHGIIPDVDLFDTRFFEFTPAEAELTDPQQRIFLQSCHAALESAGYDPGRFDGLISVYAGAAVNTYLQHNVLPNVDQTTTSRHFQVMVGNDKDYLATRVSYKLDLRGPSYTVQTACSTSLVAIHLACQGLLGGECDLALAGGVTIKLPQVRGYLYEEGAILSSDGRVRTFDAEASGTVLGNGVGVVVLKLLADAIADGDTIHAVIRGTATNNDGSLKVSYAAPAKEGQAAVIAEAHAVSGVDPGTIGYVEAHGTATRLGDPVEVSALTQAFRRATPNKNFCALGSVKSNIGHLDAAAGVAGVIKTALMLRHGQLVPTLNFDTPNPAIPLADSPFVVNTKLRDWPATDGPRRAGVSSFGIGGTNAHAVLEQPPTPVPSGPSRAEQVLVVSAKSASALRTRCTDLAEHLRRDQSVSLADVAFTLAVGRAAHRYRTAVRCADAADAVAGLLAAAEQEPVPVEVGADRVLEFVFPADIPDAARRVAELAEAEPGFARPLADCVSAGVAQDSLAGAVFTFEYATAGLWAHWGVVPSGAIASGVGRLAAACASGAISLAEAGRVLAAGEIEPPETGRSAAWPVRQAGARPELNTLRIGAEAGSEPVRLAWLAGLDVQWDQLYAGERRHRIPLPTYPFEGRRCWLDRPLDEPRVGAEQAVRSHPMLANVMSISDGQLCSVTWSGAEFYLSDHRVRGVPTLPAAAYVELAAAAGTLTGSAPVRGLRDITFVHPLTVTGQPRTGQVLVRPGRDGTEFEFRTSDSDLVFCTGRFGAPEQAADLPGRLAVDDVRRRLPDQLSATDCYQMFGTLGLDYGPSFQPVRRVAFGDGEALAELVLPEIAVADAGGFQLHPSLVDGGLQTVVALLASGGRQGVTYLPYAIGAVRWYNRVPQRCLAHVTLTSRAAEDRVVTVDVTMTDPDGAVVVRLVGLCVRVLADVESGAARLLRAEWVPAESAPLPRATGPYLVLGHDRSILDRLRGLDSAARPAVLVTAGAGFERVAEDEYRVDPGSQADFARLLAELSAQGSAPATVLHAWAGNGPDVDRGVLALFQLTKALSGMRSADPIRLLSVYELGDGGTAGQEAIAGFARSLRLESPRLAGTVVGIDQPLADALPLVLGEGGDAVAVRYQDGQRLELSYQAVDPADLGPSVVPRNGGCYLITGGGGALGLRFAEHLGARAAVHVVLLGRSVPNAAVRGSIAAIRASGSTAEYVQADVTDAVALNAQLARVRAERGGIAGVIHAAGVLRDGFLLTKPVETFTEVLAAKVRGTVLLDELTASDPLEFFVMFSSVAAAFGNVGQTDYAYANAFLDAFAAERRMLVDAEQRQGRTLAVGWPLWRDGGMVQDRESAAALRARTGLGPLSTDAGLAAFDDAIRVGGAVLVAAGDIDRVCAVLNRVESVSVGSAEPKSVSLGSAEPSSSDTGSTGEVAVRAADYLRRVLAQVTKLPVDDIDAAAPLTDYGIDSLVITELNRELETDFGALSKTLFFEYSTLGELAGYFVAEHAGRIRELTGAGVIPTDSVALPSTQVVERTESRRTGRDPVGGVAVVGLSGRYPMADDLDEFWANLAQGRDCVTEVPAGRWDHDRFFDPDPARRGHAYARWGGFLSDVTAFDPLLFGISPREAELMDPQERLFLQTAWHVVENAGYRRSALADRAVGVFVGVMYGEYQFYGAEEALRGDRAVTGSSFASIANRVSHVLGLQGPSVALDTMCSSSLTAIHLACQSLRSGESELAIAGGVNLSLHPYKYVFLSQGRFLSSDGRCRAFGAGGTGYVPGEGVGAVLLKPLAAAQRDGDHVYGVIRGSAVNHGGRTNGYTVPNPRAQQQVITRALDQAGFGPADIGYVEAHGTGTALGDPIEITALTKAYQAAGWSATRRPIGSVKSNIGHLESAAGIAGLTKILLQFQHGRLVPSLHAEPANPNIDFDGSPFAVQGALADWATPRNAALSSFGAGGSNAHLVLAESPVARPAAQLPVGAQRLPEPAVFVLSALDTGRLREYAAILGRFLRDARVSLADVAYVLQTGREPMSERLAVVTDDGAVLVTTLLGYADGAEPAGLLRGTITGRGGRAAGQPSGTEPHALADAWLAGVDVDWPSAHTGSSARRIPLPGYPFARERYWLPEPLGKASRVVGTLGHPLLDANESTLAQARFWRRLTASDRWLRDHVIVGRPMLAGAACLEMVRAAAQYAGERAPRALRNIVWGRPIVADPDSVDVRVVLENGTATVPFGVYTGADTARVTSVRGVVDFAADAVTGIAVLDLDAIRARCARRVGQEQVYQRYDAAGFRYGPGFRVMAEVRGGEGEALVRLKLPDETVEPAGLLWHPALLDGALRACHWVDADNGSGPLAVPFSLGEISGGAVLPATCYAHAMVRGGSSAAPDGLHCDITIAAEDGTVLAVLRDFCGRPPQADAQSVVEPAALTGFQQLEWVAQHPPAELSGAPLGVLAVFGGEPSVVDEVRATGRWRRVIRVGAGGGFARADADEYSIDPVDPAHFRRLVGELADEAGTVDVAFLWGLASGRDEQPRPELAAMFGESLFAVLHLLHAAADAGRLVPVRCAYLHAEVAGHGRPEHEAVAGFALSTAGPAPNFAVCTVRCDRAADDPRWLAGVLVAELAPGVRGHGTEISYQDGHRYVRRLRPAVPGVGRVTPLKDRGVYLITGGTGQIGLVLSDHLARRYRARLVLMSRSAPDEESRAVLERLAEAGAEVMVEQGDVAVAADVRRVLSAARARFGALDGVFHAAGIADDVPVDRADVARFGGVLAAKTVGTINLDVATAGDELDLFVLFSSLSAVAGDFGAASYAAANRYLDAYADRRQGQVRAGQRHGRTLALDWPLWAVGGVDRLVRPAELDDYRRQVGLAPLTAAQGMALLDQAWAYAATRLVPGAGQALPEPAVESAPCPAPVGPDVLTDRIVGYLREALSGVLKLPAARISPDTALADYGLDSVLIMEASAQLAGDFPDLRGSVFFEYHTVGELAGHLRRDHAAAAARLFGAADDPVAPAARPIASAVRTSAVVAADEPDRSNTDGDIAIIGMSGRYPGAADLDEFWRNLRAGTDSVGPVPADRWDADALFDPDPAAAGRSYGRWGGFLSDVDAFDSLFFQISPLQAKSMDPQERLFLEAAWSALEDAGYPPAALPVPRFGGQGRDVGVFVGAMWDDYAMLGAEESFRGNHVVVLANRSSIANQVSYFGDFRGPSVVIDTACSASLVALHQACESIRRGECAYAIAGGVNVSVHPLKYVHLSRKTMLAKDGRCRSFGAGGTGYVPGEGVGAVLLKPLAAAIADGDHIHAVIRSSVVNHGGRTSGFTVPNPQAQQALVEQALAVAGIDARTIGYVEAHGTGTALGDPIEHTGLESAYSRTTRDRGFCALGSVKSNIGHLEGAAGIAGVTKAVLQLREGELVPSLHAEELNPAIDFGRSPFTVQRRLAPWPRAVVVHESRPVEQPRRAAVSSFGAGGTNAHVILEEFVPPIALPDDPGATELIVLSARDEPRLRASAARLTAFLDQNGPLLTLRDVAHTLRVGRAELPERLAFVATGMTDLVARLREFGQGTLVSDVARSNASGHAELARVFADEYGRDFLRAQILAGHDDKLAQLWVRGLAIDWQLWDELRPAPRRRVSLPTYPFERQRHWIASRPDAARAGDESVVVAAPEIGPHRITVSAADSVLRDHVVGGRPVLPGVGHLDLVLSALGRSAPVLFTDVRWRSPIVVDGEQVELTVTVGPDGEGYQVRGADQETVHSEGVLRDGALAGPAALPVAELVARCAEVLSGDALYAGLAAQGLAYGPFFRAVTEVGIGAGELVGRLRLADATVAGRYPLHPGMLDAALHTLGALLLRRGPDAPVLLPFAVDRVEVYQPVPAQGYSHVVDLGGNRCHVTITDEAGRICVRLRDLAYRELRDADPGMCYQPVWRLTPLPPANTAPDGRRVLIVAPESARELADALAARHRDAEVTWCPVGADGLAEAEIDTALDRARQPDLVYFLADPTEPIEPVDLAALAASQNTGVIALFRLARALDSRGALAAAVGLKVVTVGAFPLGDQDRSRPWPAGLPGLAAVLGKEYPRLSVSIVDIREASAESSAALVAAEPVAGSGAELVSLRGNARYVRRLRPVSLPAGTGGFRTGGVYLVVGGLGVVGFDTCEYLARRYRAKLVLLGRSVLDDAGRERLARLERAGAHPRYIRCDAADPVALADAVGQARRLFGELHGVINAAMVLTTTAVCDTDEATLRSSLRAKVDTTWSLGQVLRHERLDFLLLYSSGASFAVNQGQAGYVAGCWFQDAYARHHARTLDFPVRIVNWGYWHPAGDPERERLLRPLAAAGIATISAAEGMAVLERVLAGEVPQVLATKATDQILTGLGVDLGDAVHQRPRRLPAARRSVTGSVPIRADDGSIADHQRAGAELTRLGHTLLLGVFGRLGVLRSPGDRCDLAILPHQLGITEGHVRLFQVCVRMLVDAGLARVAGGELVATDLVGDPAVRSVLADPDGALRALVDTHPGSAPVARLLVHCLRAYPEVLTGRTSQLDVLFPDGSMELVSGVYQGTVVTDRCNDLVAELVRRHVELRLTEDSTARVSILEVGAGTGSTTVRVLPVLREYADRVRYTYTDISGGFVRHGRRRFAAEYPFVEFETFDVEAPLAGRPERLRDYDIVLGTNVFHATRRIHHTLTQVKHLLVTGGLVVVNEGRQVDPVLTLIFGLTDGWWLFEDPEVRLPDSPLLAPQQWADALACTGFDRISVHALAATELGEADQAVLVAVSDGVVGDGVPADPVVAVAEPAPATVPVAPLAIGPDGRLAAAREYVTSVFARVLELAPDQLDARATFENYGVDSLVALELTRALEQRVGPLPATLLFERITIEQLAAHLVEQHGDAFGAAPPASTDEPADDPADEVTRLVNELSEADVDELLGQLLGPSGQGGNAND